MPNQLYLPGWTVAEAVIDSEAAYQIAATYDVPPEDLPQVRRALSNLRPLWAVDNIRKSDTRTHLL